ncbi:uncharacterized protein LOC126784572 [Argentina anserina]|uniref:uncharacterized protein LOC126784572 n=1 Tax=Argentina anserina TaxID=57926 RepID=UPI0021763D99|nr:uncharacterized protein LOC126784572 [Potentilla anserina]XP_050365995.1 uncharacterized protein LOC126784572 [Potentilla anserina]
MAFRGRGRGRGGGAPRYSKEEPFLPFPDTILPDARGILSELDQKRNKGLKEEETLIIDTLYSLMKSEYNLDMPGGHDKNVEISEESKRKRKREIDSFKQYLVLSMFPEELPRGSNVRQVKRENVKWNKLDTENSEMYWNEIEKREQNLDAKKQKEGEKDEEEDDDAEEEEEEDEDSSNEDYQQTKDFDDDEDDFNPEECDDEPELDM